MKKKSRNKREDKIYFLVLTLCIVFLIIISVYRFYYIVERVDFDTSVEVSDRMGFDLNGSALTFGKVSTPGQVSREVELTNDYDREVMVDIRSKGDVSDFLVVSKNNFILGPKESEKLSFSVYIPEDAQMREYKGKTTVIFKRVF